MGSVNGRVAQLEKATLPTKQVSFAWVDWAVGEDGKPVSANFLGVSYLRQPGESGAGFRQRVMAAAPVEMITLSWRIGGED